jgi:hypothetical protein
MMAVVPGEYSFMVAQWALPSFLNDKLVKEPSVINVEGKRPDGTKVDAIEEGIKSLQDGRNLVIFPEGTAPSPQGETRPLRTGIDVVVEAVADYPVAIVPVVIDDPSIDWEGSFVKSEDEKVQITVTFGEPIDPLKMKAVPGGGRDLMLDAIRAYWHRTLYRPDVDLSVAQGVEVLGVIPPNRVESFEELHLP